MTNPVHLNFGFKRYFGIFAVLTAIIFGLSARFKGLGITSLGVDEFYFASSVNNILNKGIPEFDCGGYYMRGVLYQYLQAMLTTISPFNAVETMRGFNALLNILMLPAAYMLAKRLTSDAATSALVLVILSLSLWEIEFSRYLRMYIPFQTIFLWYVLFLYISIKNSNSLAFMALIFLSILSVFVYAGAIFLLVLNFMPIVFVKKYRRPIVFVVVAGIFSAAYFYYNIDFRFGGLPSNLPDGVAPVVSESGSGSISMPKLLVSTLSENMAWAPFFILFLTLSLIVWIKTVKDINIPRETRLCLVVIGLLSLFNLFFLASFVLLFLVTFQWLPAVSFTKKSLTRMVLIVSCWLLFWFIYGINTTSWHSWFPGEGIDFLKKLLVIFFKYPDIHTKIIHQWFSVIPYTTLLLGATVIFGLFYGLKNKDLRFEGLYLVTAFVFICVLLVSVLNTTYYEIRYTFFLFPLVVVIAISCVSIILNQFSPKLKFPAQVMLIFSYLIISDDVSFERMMKIDDPSKEYTSKYWFRRDFKTPAEYINVEFGKGDTIVTTIAAPGYYLDKLDFIYQDPLGVEFQGISACGGNNELWTNASLLYTKPQLVQLISSSDNTIWVLAHNTNYTHQNEVEKFLELNYKKYLRYTSVDKRLNVYGVFK